MPYLTPETLPTDDYVCRTVKIPNTLDAIAAVNGAILALAQPYNWEKSSPTALTPEEMADAMFTLYYNYQRSRCDVIVGEIKMLSFLPIPNNCLRADGAYYAKAEWPELAALYAGTIYDIDETTFSTPFITGRTPVAVGPDSEYPERFLGDIWGTEELEILLENLPVHSHTTAAHTHGEGIAVPTVINGGLEAPASAAQAGVGTTGFGGGDDTGSVGEGDTIFIPQPSYGLIFVVVARS